jgi:hypothetical protein
MGIRPVRGASSAWLRLIKQKQYYSNNSLFKKNNNNENNILSIQKKYKNYTTKNHGREPYIESIYS